MYHHVHISQLRANTAAQPDRVPSEDTNMEDLLPSTHRSGSLVVPPEFHHLQLGIDVTHHVLVCQGCGLGIHRSWLETHIRKKHGGRSQLPKNYEKVLDEYQLPHRTEQPSRKIVPIQSIEITDGFMCTFPGCYFAGLKEESITRNHSSVHTFANLNHRVVPCAVQVVYRGYNGRQVWAVENDYSAFCGEGIDFHEFFEGIVSEEEHRWTTMTMMPPTDPRHINGFLAMFHWLDLTSGHSPKMLSSVTQPPAPRSLLFPLTCRVKDYFDSIHPMVWHMSPLILKWVNSVTE
jgi:hypothetical protein